jgi:hypothetical protein
MVALRTDHPRQARDVLRSIEEVQSAALFGDAVHALLRPDVPPPTVSSSLVIHLVGGADA